MRVITEDTKYPYQSPPAIMIHVLKENKRPIGFAPWPEEEVSEVAEEPPPKKRRKKK